jgi:uncharacterized membrane protein HdeD (DUF308 family)
MQPQQWVMFILGIILVVLGCGLIIWGYVQKTVRPKAIPEVTSLVEQIAKLFDALGNFFGPDPAMRAGGFLVIVGVALMVGAFYIPTSRA